MNKPQRAKKWGVIFMVVWLALSLLKWYHGEPFNKGGVSTVFLVLGLVFLITGAYQESKEQ